jgi:hypothetical protein
MSRNDQDPFFVKFLKSSGNSECFLKALEVRIIEHVFFDAVNSFSCFLFVGHYILEIRHFIYI